MMFLFRGVHRSRTQPDRLGPKIEMGEGCGPRTGLDRAMFGPDWAMFGPDRTGPIKDRPFV